MKRFALKRITALVLALVMTLSLLPMNVWAEGESDPHIDDFFINRAAEDVASYPTDSIFYLRPLIYNPNNQTAHTPVTKSEWSVALTPDTESGNIGSVTWYESDDVLVWNMRGVAPGAKGALTFTNSDSTQTYTVNMEAGHPEVSVYNGDNFLSRNDDGAYDYASGSKVTLRFVARDNVTIKNVVGFPAAWIAISSNAAGNSATVTIPANAYGNYPVTVKIVENGGERDFGFYFRDTNDISELFWSYNPEYDGWNDDRATRAPGGSNMLYLKTKNATSTEIKGTGWSAAISSSSALGSVRMTNEGLLWDRSGVTAAAIGAGGIITVSNSKTSESYDILVGISEPEIHVYTGKSGDTYSGEQFADAEGNYTYTSNTTDDVVIHLVAREDITIKSVDGKAVDGGKGNSTVLTIPKGAYGSKCFVVKYIGEGWDRENESEYWFRDTNDTSELFWNYNPQNDPWSNDRATRAPGGSNMLYLKTKDATSTEIKGTDWSAAISPSTLGSVSMTDEGLLWNRSGVTAAAIDTRGTITVSSKANSAVSYTIPVGIEAPQIWVYNTKTIGTDGKVTYSDPQFADAEWNYTYTSNTTNDVTIHLVAREDMRIISVDGKSVSGDKGNSATLTIPANAWGQQKFLVEYERDNWSDESEYWFRDTNDTSELLWNFNPKYDDWGEDRATQTPGGSNTLYLKTKDANGTEIAGNDWSATISPATLGSVSMTNEGLYWDRSELDANDIGHGGTITVSSKTNSAFSYTIPVGIEAPQIWVYNTKMGDNYSNPQFADAEWNYTYTSSTTNDVTIHLVAREDMRIISVDGEPVDGGKGNSVTVTIPKGTSGEKIFKIKYGDDHWSDESEYWFRDTNDEGTIFYRHHEADPWHNWRMEEPVGGNSRIFLALDEEGKLLDISTPWTASASENVGKVIVFGDILYWDRSQALPGATGTITITNGTDTYRLPVSIGVPWMLMFEGEISPENLVNPDENDTYYYPTDEDKKNTVVFVPSADYVTIDSVDAPSDIGVRIAEDKKSVTVTIPEGRHGEFHMIFNFTETFGEEQHKNYRSLWVRDDGAKAKLTPGKLIKESDYIQWESKDEIFHVDENVPVPFTLSIDGKEQTFYMLPAMINEGVLSSAWLNWCGIPTWSNEGGLYYAVDYWTSDNGGKDLAPISDELRGKINAMVESASITIAPVAGYEGNVGTRYPSSARGDDIPRNIRETFGNRLAAVGYCHNLDTLGMWQVKTTVKFKNGLELTTALSSKSEYLAVYDHPMEADATVADINAYIASFKENYPNANPQQSTLNLSLPGKELHGLIVVDPETAPKEIQLMGCEDGVGETVLYGSVYANNFSTRLMNIRMVGAGKNNTTYKDKGEIQWADELIGTPNYGVYGSAYGYIHCCSFTGYRTAVYSKADWYRFGMGYSLFYDNHTALYMECTDPNGGGVPTMAGNVYMDNQFALWLERFPTNFDTSTFGTDDNIFIDNQKDIHSGNRSYFAPGNAFGTLTSNGNKAVPNTTGKAHAAPYYGVTDTGLTVLSGNLSQLPLDTLSQELSTWIGDVKLYPNNWAVPNYGDAEIYMISVDDITDGMTISTIDKTSDSDNDVLGTIKLKKNK